MSSGRRDAGERGFALLLVLWSLVLLTLIVSSLVAGGRGEVRLAANLRAAAIAEAVADGAVHEAIFHLLDRSEAGWRPDGLARELTLPGGHATVRIEDQAGLVNPNRVTDALMQALLRRLGADQRQAESIAAAIADWRSPSETPRPLGGKAPQYRQAGLDYAPPNAPFRSVAELRLVLGMTPALFERLAPHLTVFWDGDPEASLASPTVLQALRDATGQMEFAPSSGAGTRLLAVIAEADVPGGGHFVRRALVRVGADLAERPFRVLAWERSGEG